MEYLQRTLVVCFIVTLMFATIGSSRRDKVKLTFWHWWGGKREPLMEQIIADFEAEYPWIEVEQVVQPWDRRSENSLPSRWKSPEVIMTPTLRSAPIDQSKPSYPH